MKKTGIRCYRDLVVWQRAIEVAEASYGLARGLPSGERFGLAQQIRKAGTSIPANIAEGHGREHRGDYLRFLSIAKGSLMELETHVLLAERLGYVGPEATSPLLSKTAEVSRMLSRLIAALRRTGAV